MLLNFVVGSAFTFLEFQTLPRMALVNAGRSAMLKIAGFLLPATKLPFLSRNNNFPSDLSFSQLNNFFPAALVKNGLTLASDAAKDFHVLLFIFFASSLACITALTITGSLAHSVSFVLYTSSLTCKSGEMSPAFTDVKLNRVISNVDSI